MKMKKIILMGASAVTVLAAASCGGNNTVSGVKCCLASTPDFVDPALNSSVDGATYAVHLFGNLVRYVPNASGELELAADLAKALPEAKTTSDGKTQYTFELRDGIKFSDGTAIKASDFVASWTRAASYSVVDDKGTEETSDDVTVVDGLDADYGYMFEVIDGYDSLTTTSKDADKYSFLNVKADDEKGTLTVTLPVDVPYFYELCAFPAYAVLKDAWNLDKDGLWAKSASAVTSGAYTISSFEDDVQMVMTKRDDYWDAANTTCDNITCIFSDDDSAVYGMYQAGEIEFSDSVPQSMINELSKGSDYYNIGQLGTYYFCYNINSDCLQTGATKTLTQSDEEEIRQALNLLIDRQSIIDNIAQAGQTPSTGFVGSGLTDPAGGEFVDHNGVNGDGSGYFGDASNYAANKAKALEILAKYYTVKDGQVSGLSLDYLYNTSTGHKAIAEGLQAQFAAVGIKLNVTNQDWAQFLQTRKKGNYDTARNGWLADYNDPISFLDMWTTDSGNNDCQFGRDDAAKFQYSIDLTGIGSYTKLEGTWAETYDVLISSIKTEKDKNIRYKLMHKAEDLLMSTGCIGSIYNYTDNYLQKAELKNVYASPLGYKYFTWSTIEK